MPGKASRAAKRCAASARSVPRFRRAREIEKVGGWRSVCSDDAVALGQLEQRRRAARRSRRCRGRSAGGCRGSRPARPSPRRACRGSRGRLRRATRAARTSTPIAVATALERDAGAGDERLEQHVARAGAQAVAAGGGMQPGRRSAPCPVWTRQVMPSPSVAVGVQRDDGRRRALAVLLLQRRLQFLKSFRIHAEIILRPPACPAMRVMRGPPDLST